MRIERTTKAVIITLPASINTEDLQDFLNYTRYKELTSNIDINQEEIDKLTSKINKDWWTKNRKKFIK